jgi:hypothetical protein
VCVSVSVCQCVCVCQCVPLPCALPCDAKVAQLVKWRTVLFLSHRRRRTGRVFLLWFQCLCDARALKREQRNVLHCLTLAAQTVTNLVCLRLHTCMRSCEQEQVIESMTLMQVVFWRERKREQDSLCGEGVFTGTRSMTVALRALSLFLAGGAALSTGCLVAGAQESSQT